MRSPRAISPFLLTFAAACAAPRTDRYGPIGGESEFSVGSTLSYTNTDASDTTNLLGQVGLGWFITDLVEIGGNAIFGVSRTETTGSSTSETVNAGLYPYVHLNFRISERAWFFFGPHAGVLYLDSGMEDDAVLSGGVRAGFKFWITPQAALFIRPEYTRYEFDDTDVDQIQTVLGFAYSF